jgi:hypothetical protein
MQWETVVQKFSQLSIPYTTAQLRKDIVDAVANLEAISITNLTRLLAQVHIPSNAVSDADSKEHVLRLAQHNQRRTEPVHSSH